MEPCLRKEYIMNDQKKKSNGQDTTKLYKAMTIVGIALCVILVPILIVNCTLIVKSFVNKDEIPDFGGMIPLIVLTDSMEPVIKKGDIIISKTVDAPSQINDGDVISFYDPAGNGTSVVTHRVMYKVIEGEDQLLFKTAGDSNVKNSGGNAENEQGYDKKLVPAEDVIGVYTNIRIPIAGHIALFMQSTAGLIVCVVVPLLLLIGYDVIRRRFHDKNKGKDVDALMAELEALKAEKANAEVPVAEAPVAEAPVEETADKTE